MDVPLAMAVDVDEDDRILPEWHDFGKESGMTPVTMGTLKKSFGAPREQWRQALQNELDSFESPHSFERLSKREAEQVKPGR